jgi:hypothetical protein
VVRSWSAPLPRKCFWQSSVDRQNVSGREAELLAGEEDKAVTTVAEVLDRHTARLMLLAGVVGTAEGRCAGQPCILVLVERLTPALRQAIPSELEGIPVEIRETGRIEAR